MAVAWALGAGACLQEPVVRCDDGRLCPREMACDDAHGGCVLPEQLAGCTDKAEAAACSYPGVTRGACYERVCLPAGCGNGIQEPGEACDDHNRVHGDGCSGDCRSDERCGNAIVDLSIGEPCEPVGETAAWCRADCTSVRCGDGIVDREFEECDDGARNGTAPDAACRPDCRPSRCGDGVRDGGEVCDDGNRDSGDGCAANCNSDESCGNGVIDGAVGESCDHGGKADAWCRPSCVTVRCGDGKVDHEAFEQCDEGSANSEAPDATCRPNCQPRRCGDGFRDSDEVCDDGNRLNGDGCSHDCRSRETCRNGYRDIEKGEECDDGNALSHDGCSSGCRTESLAVRKLLPSFRPLCQPPAVYDAARGRILCLYDSNEMLEIDGDRAEVVPFAGKKPKVFMNHGMAWDAARQRTVVFGGMSLSFEALDETWEWDGARWTQRTPRTRSPSLRYGPALSYDPVRRVVVLFGGSYGDPLGDTWEWDGEDWREVATAEAPPPGEHLMTYDPRAGRIVLFDHRDLWTFDGASWSRTPTSSPLPERVRSTDISFFHDAGRGRLAMMFHDEQPVPFLGRTWEWDGQAWLDTHTATPFEPYQLSRPMAFYDPRRRAIVLLDRGNRWTSDGASWTAAPFATDSPPARYSVRLAYDPLHASTLLFGEDETSRTWLWDGLAWRFRDVEPAPSARSGQAMVYHSAARRILLFGGEDASGVLADTWSWEGSSWQLEQPPEAPSRRAALAMADDSRRGRVLLFGGNSLGVFGEGALGDTWSWDGSSWQPLPTAVTPEARHAHALGYDPLRDRVLLWGGIATDDDFGHTWEWTGDAWVELSNLDWPPLRMLHALVYDPNRGQTVLSAGGPTAGTGAEDFWGWPTRGAGGAPVMAWEQLVGSSSLPRAEGQAVVYESARRRLLLVGGDREDVLETWEVAHRAPGEVEEACDEGYDLDGDTLRGCADPDCWPFCTPLCPPGTECPDDAPRCGDGLCNEALETCRLCPGDCGCASLCGDFRCDADESPASCPGDCAAR